MFKSWNSSMVSTIRVNLLLVAGSPPQTSPVTKAPHHLRTNVNFASFVEPFLAHELDISLFSIVYTVHVLYFLYLFQLSGKLLSPVSFHFLVKSQENFGPEGTTSGQICSSVSSLETSCSSFLTFIPFLCQYDDTFH